MIVGSAPCVEEQLDQLEIAGEGRPHQRGREDDARRALAHPGARRVVDERVRIGAGVEQLADERQRILRHHPREVRRRLHVAPIDGPEQRRKPLRVGLVDVGLAVDQERCHVVVAVEDRQRQRGLAVAGHRVDIGAGVDEQARQLDVALARGEHQRRQPAAGELLRACVGRRRHRRAPLEPAAVGGGHVVRPRVHVRACARSAALAASGCRSDDRPHQRASCRPISPSR